MRRALLLTAVLASLAAPAAADAATRHVIRGAGWGHGIGLSQYGAYGYALEGTSYRRILAHYYQDTHLAPAPQRTVRVLLQQNDPYIRVRGATRAGGRRLNPAKTYIARRSGGRVSLATTSGHRVGSFAGLVRVERPGHSIRLLGPAVNGVTSGRYRGVIEIRADGGVTAIDVLPLDDYARGVVGGEMPSSWPLEALKAQAVTARTYALATLKTGAAYDLYPDTRSQVYRGVTAESVRTDAAVESTAGKILTYSGEPAVTYYFSTSGGHTESIQFSFVGALSKPWLVGVPDPYDYRSPYHRWQQSFSTAALTSALGTRGRFRRVKVLQRGTSPRIVKARVIGSRGSTVLSGPTIRARLGLRDTWMRFITIKSAARAARTLRRTARGSRVGPDLITGSFEPTPRGQLLVLERRGGGGWRRVAVIHTSARGRYRTTVNRPGVYRVRAGTVAGPAVRAR